MLDCFNIWLHNQSGGTARWRFSDLVLTGIKSDFYYNLNFKYANADIEKAIHRFQEDLKELGLDLLSEPFSIRDQSIPILREIMVSRIINEIASEEERRILFLLGKYYSSQSSDFYGSIHDPIQFERSLRGLYLTSFGEETKAPIFNFLCKLGLVLLVDWVPSRRPESYKQRIISSWANDFLENIENYIRIKLPEITDKIEAYMQLVSEKGLVHQLLFFDLLLDKDLWGRDTFFKSEPYVKDQLESLIPGSYSNIQFRPGVCDKFENLIFISPLVRVKIADALRSVKKNRTAEIEKLIEEILSIFRDKIVFESVVISEHPKIWRIDGPGTSLSVIVSSWCKQSDAEYFKQLSEKVNNIVFFVRDQKLPVLERMFKENPKISFAFVKEKQVLYTSEKNEILKMILDSFREKGFKVKLISEPMIKDIEKTPAYKILEDLENTLRRFISTELEKRYGDKWWDLGVPESVRRSCKENKIRREKPYPWITSADFPLIYYADLKGYSKIILDSKNWQEIFQHFFKDNSWVLTRFKELEPIRNDIAHHREILEDDLLKLQLYTKELKRCSSSSP